MADDNKAALEKAILERRQAIVLFEELVNDIFANPRIPIDIKEVILPTNGRMLCLQEQSPTLKADLKRSLDKMLNIEFPRKSVLDALSAAVDTLDADLHFRTLRGKPVSDRESVFLGEAQTIVQQISNEQQRFEQKVNDVDRIFKPTRDRVESLSSVINMMVDDAIYLDYALAVANEAGVFDISRSLTI